MSLDFSRRWTMPEWMDDPDTSFEVFQGCLVDLEKVNRLTLAYRPTLNFLEKLVSSQPDVQGNSLSVLDVGFGYGDMLRRIRAWSRRRGVHACLTGVDVNPWSAIAARSVDGSEEDPIEWRTANIFDLGPGECFDVIVSSLFAHHLSDGEAARFVRWMESHARLGWFVNDIRRNALAYQAFRLASRALRMHSFVQHDGPISIGRAFRAADWEGVIGSAGLSRDAVSIDGLFPFRLCVTRLR